MACTPEYHERLIDLAAGRVAGAEADAVLEHVLTCPDCSGEFELLADLTLLQERQASAASDPSPRAWWYRHRAWRAAAALLLSAVVAAWVVFRGPAQELSELADITPVPFVGGILRSGSEDRTRHFEKAMAAYKNGDFEGTGTALAALLEADPQDHKLRIYLGIANLQLGAVDGAVEILAVAADRAEGLIAERALWYLGMAHLLRDDAAAARTTFERLRAMTGSYELNAVEMLEKIEDRERS